MGVGAVGKRKIIKDFCNKTNDFNYLKKDKKGERVRCIYQTDFNPSIANIKLDNNT